MVFCDVRSIRGSGKVGGEDEESANYISTPFQKKKEMKKGNDTICGRQKGK